MGSIKIVHDRIPTSTDQACTFNDETYSQESIRALEYAFGERYISNGGEETNSRIVVGLGLKSGDFVLDVGCGIGGSAFHMAQSGVKVHAVDFSTNMIAIANQYLAQETEEIKNLVTFERNDILTCDYPENTFDKIYSRDVALHIGEKEKLFAFILKWLKPGGMLLFTDICEGEINPHTDVYDAYIARYRLSLTRIIDYKSILQKAGFQDVIATDETKECLAILNKELDRLKTDTRKEGFLKISNEAMYKYITEFWMDKLRRFGAGDNAWGHFKGIKPRT